jgi:hypothetical protein
MANKCAHDGNDDDDDDDDDKLLLALKCLNTVCR